MWVSSDENSFNFIAPAGASEQTNEKLFPWPISQSPAQAAAYTPQLSGGKPVVNLGALSGDIDFNVVPDEKVSDGDTLLATMTDSGGAGDVITLGAAFQSASLTLVTGKTYLAKFVYLAGVYWLESFQVQ